MLRITLAVAAGFLIMSVFVIATQVALLRYLFHTAPGVDVDLLPPAYFLAYGVVRRLYVMNRSGEPVWYAVSVGLVGAMVATIAGYRWLGRLPAEVRR